MSAPTCCGFKLLACRRNISMTGMTYDRVLPEPVHACCSVKHSAQVSMWL